MITLEIVPHQRLGPVLLGSTRTEAREALSTLGFPLESSRRASDYFCGASIQVEFGPDDRVWFIGIAPNKKFSARLQGQDIFNLSAEDLFSLLSRLDNSGPHSFDPSEYQFPNQIVTLWEADEQYDVFGNESRPVWGQVGIGSTLYASAVAAIKAKA